MQSSDSAPPPFVSVTKEILFLKASVPVSKEGTPLSIFSQFCESPKQRPSEPNVLALDAEVVERQSAINHKVRELLKSIRRPPNTSLDIEASEYIHLGTSATSQTIDQCQEDVVPSLNKAQGITTNPPTTVNKENNAKDVQTSFGLSSPSCPTSSSFCISVPPLATDDPPWYVFLGFNAKKLKSLKKSSSPTQNGSNVFHNWTSALDDINENLDFFGRLHEELHALVSWLEPTPEEILLRQRILAKITIVAQALWPECSVIPFGSYYTGLWLPIGDMDISIMNVKGPQILNLKILTICLIRLGIPVAVEVISSARVPIVKFIDSESGISVDLSLNTDSAMATSEYIYTQLKTFPWLRPLIMIVKLYLYQRNLGETYRGGIGSYLLFVLCLSFLQQHRSLALPDLRNSVGLGHLLFDFLQLYGRDFNYDTTAISVRDGGRYFPKTERQWFDSEKPSFLAVESPLAPELDIGRNSFEVRTVRNCFRQSFLTLAELLVSWNDGNFNKRDSIVKRFIFTKDPLMTRRRRTPLMFTGSSLLEKSDWWESVKGYFNQPVGGSRPKPNLSPALLKQMEADILSANRSITEFKQELMSKRMKNDKPSRHSRIRGNDVDNHTYPHCISLSSDSDCSIPPQHAEKRRRRSSVTRIDVTPLSAPTADLCNHNDAYELKNFLQDKTAEQWNNSS